MCYGVTGTAGADCMSVRVLANDNIYETTATV